MRYPGGKNLAGVWQRIINLIPPHDIYVEPFLGSGAILRRKRPAEHNIGVDRDDVAIARFLAELDSPEAVSAMFGVEVGEVSHVAVPEMNGTVVRVSEGTRSWWCDVRRGDGMEILEGRVFDGQEFVYCDPPYLPSTRTGGPRYRHEMTAADHNRLLTICKRLPCRVMLSGYDSALYRLRLPDWNTVHFPVVVRGGGSAEEWLWMNYDPPSELHDYRFVGDGWRDRQRINRRRARWKTRVKKLPDLERRALLSDLQKLW